MKKTVAFCTLGCKVNQYETDAMRGSFEAEGYEVKEFSQEASVYVINTCTVTNMADRKSRQMMHRAKKKNPDGIIVAVGCYVQAAKEQLEEDTLIDLVIGNNMKSQVVQIVEQYIQDNRHTEDRDAYVADIAHSHEYETMHIETVSEHTRAYIKIQDGCNQFCSYCIIPYARGRVRSRKMEDILQEVRNLTANGYKEIVLTGIHISSYGLDFEHTADEQEDYVPFKNSALIDLIEALSGIEGLERIRLGSLEPRIITENFVRRLCKVPQICPHFHLSLQSGCDETLKRMNRHYTTALYLEKCGILRQYFDRPALTTDVIVGFPGETEEEFAQTERFLETVHFSDMHIFKYSKRRGTKAADMPNQIDPQLQSVRSEKLIALGKRMKDDFLEACKDQEQIVLIEEETEIDGTKYMTGHSKNYIRCAFEMDGLVPNMVIKGTINSKLNEEFVFCKRID
ncbi:tRNA (N(6)-L-threonylcarbamoyladenosine(37)-C(2))-methylthiotransferase MtaB [Coprococcus catus]|uniref:Threonylcarbamoyladenosine tRNA methylthiotransferase MtaB n=2 Tax=Coprococcus catus TaxID=116085 RepID=A0A3E2TQQ2_9FIRM|nr:tRNA (N(6)-L-threonylcarbamoyladenosine(37)-C(2))-methylthiotransferase MtaB [Coprococcus catus]RGB81048.1 tRNA (N(6)-L-threonylcarbamoyladenosine(37)-C(2))-methylthiotransferase MtaB [Coprococcus catus]RGC50480.1 tRNA (N(6)-L-threonylcarbamoyladenosine(37)-C(2))-methylthiotransferase MtaB [Coprococcus catus]CBK81035.1 MiaB-like tRNA modifying enzyme [Coprococcus catus GD/7]